MDMNLRSLPHLHPEVKEWNATMLSQWVTSLYDHDHVATNRIEESLIGLATRVHERGRTLAEFQRHLRGQLFRESLERLLEEHYVDINLCLRDIVSLRPPGQNCPVRTLNAETIHEIRAAGGIRESVW